MGAALLFAAGIAPSGPLTAQGASPITLIQTAGPAPVTEAADAARRALDERGLDVITVEIAPRQLRPIPDGDGPIVAIGVAPTHYAARNAGGRPVFYALVAHQQLPRMAAGTELHGVAIESTLLDQMDVITRAQPDARRFGVLEAEPEFVIRELERGAERLGIELVFGANPAELIRADIDMIWLGHATSIEQPHVTRMLLLHGVRARVPVVAPVPSLVIQGAPIGLGMSPGGHGRQVAALVADYLDGEPCPRITRPQLELHVNDRTMRACGMRLHGAPARVVHHGRPPR